MEKQVILAARVTGNRLYFSKWSFNKRHCGSHNYAEAIRRFDEPYKDEKISREDYPLLMQKLIKWSEE